MGITTPESLLSNGAVACRILEMEGHGDMTLGHVSLRDPEGHGFWMKRNSIGLGEVLGASDFVLLNWRGEKLAGDGQQHSEWPIHSEIFKARRNVSVVVHSHPFHTCVFSSSTEPLQPYTLDADYFIDVPRHIDETALITTEEQGQALASTLGDHFAVLMSNHGVTFCGATIEQAICVGVFLEKACRAQVIGKGSGLPISMPDSSTRELRRSQMMTPRHWSHSWDYFRRKLETRERQTGTRALFA
ncbi:MAG TPA: class II aldolase/adducin family protein [Xanthobacteraceae bacterium]|jgi:ribulose-5-phosphate 4-epimerase/fuculose-1-phosphate aldolase|nr:class II aldolase/adducin family protein [Xanthobacteraceae bacterium]